MTIDRSNQINSNQFIWPGILPRISGLVMKSKKGNDAMPETDLNAYCILCRTGAEQEVKEKIERFMSDIEALVPTRVLEEKKDRQWHKVERPILPGYVFLYAVGELPFDLVWKISHLYRILQYERGLRSLQGEDRDYAFWLYRHQGQIQPSTVLQEGETIRVINGPLLDATGKITRLDKRHRRAWVEFTFDGQTRTVSLSASCVEADQPESVKTVTKNNDNPPKTENKLLTAKQSMLK